MAENLISSFSSLCIKPFSIAQGLKTLEMALVSKHNELLALDVIPETTTADFMKDCLATIEGLDTTLDKKQKGLNIEGLSKREIKERLLDEMNTIGKEILKLDENTPLSNAKSYFEVGFNSLSLNQYRSRLNQFLGREIIAISILFKHTSINKLANFVLDRIVTEAQKPQVEENVKDILESYNDLSLIDEVNALSDSEIEKLINQNYKI